MADLTLRATTRGARPELPLPPTFRADRTLLALDLGTTTGWAVQAADGLITSGTVSFRPSRYDGGGMTPLGESSGMIGLEVMSNVAAAFLVEVVVNRGLGGLQFLQTSHLPESQHSSPRPKPRWAGMRPATARG